MNAADTLEALGQRPQVPMDGFFPEAGAYGRKSLKHVSEKLYELDATQDRKRIWEYVWRKCEVVYLASRVNTLAHRVRYLAQRKPVSRERVLSQAKEYVASLKGVSGSAPCLPIDRFNDESGQGPSVSCSAVTLAEKCAVIVANHDSYFEGEAPLLAHADFDGTQLDVWLGVVRHVEGHVYRHVERVEGWHRDVLDYLRSTATEPAVSNRPSTAVGTPPSGRHTPAATNGEPVRGDVGDDPLGNTGEKPKKSTHSGDGDAKIIPTLTAWHKYEDGSVQNQVPIGNNELARKSNVDKATASAFFKKHFKGHAKYKVMCAQTNSLIAALKLLNNEFRPYLLYGAVPPGETEHRA